MVKIPVGETIRYAYRFTFGHLGAIIGLIWLPMVCVTVAGFFAGQRYYAELAAALTRDDFAAMGPAVLMMLGYLVLALLLYTMMYVSVTELALGTRKPGAIVHFAFGRTEWRLFRAVAALIGLLVLPAAILALAASLGGVALAPVIGKAGASAVTGAMLLLLDFGLVFVALRFAFLLAPAAVAGKESSVLERAWTLSAGNFWRILAVLLASVGPFLLATLAVQILLLGPPGASQGASAAQIQHISVNMPLVTGFGFLVSPIMLGLMLGAGAFAYRALAGAPTPQP